MVINGVATQLRTTDLGASIEFYTEKLGFELEFRHEDFYAAILAGTQSFHLKLVDEKDPSIDYVDHGDHFHLYFAVADVASIAETFKGNGVELVKDVHDTAWGTREFVIKDNQGHTLYFAESR